MLVVVLTDPQASVPELTGAKAANIARCARVGLPTLPGFVLTTAGTARGLADPEVLDVLRAAWHSIDGDIHPVVVRSSSTIEDIGASSMAGRFTSVLDVATWDGLLAATQRVIDSADAVRDDDGVARPIGVLVQLQLDTDLGGVMFGVDPVTGQLDHVVVEVVAARPDVLVSGVVTADHYVLSRRGRVLQHATVATPVALTRRIRRQLVRMAERAASEFGSPQDVEWAVDHDDRLWLLQSRPVTAVAPLGDERAVVLGAGPVAETFPAPLARLEDELWIGALGEGVVRALRATGAVGDAALAASPVVTTVGGWAAVDLELFGLTSGHTSWRRRLNLTAIVRRLGTAWRVGRLRVALPRLAAAVVDTVDRDLVDVGSLHGRTPAELMDLLHRSSAELATVHSYEVLCGMLLQTVGGAATESTTSAPLVALCALGDARRRGWTDDDAIAHHPVLLALTAPSLEHPPHLPAGVTAPIRSLGQVRSLGSVDELSLRDALRLRARWLQELQSRIVQRLCSDEFARYLTLEELTIVAAGGGLPTDLATRARQPIGPPLPTSFRIGFGGSAVATSGQSTGGASSGLPAGGGRGSGAVVHELVPGAPRVPGEGVVLVTQHLAPHLAAVLPELDGLVAETGSALSHVAILAREMGVPTVAGLAGARARFTPGMRVVVDGTAGTVEVIAHSIMEGATA